MLKGEFTLKDLRQQMRALNRMGPLSQVLDMVPGLGGSIMDELPDDAMDVTQERMHAFNVIMDSMTEEELENPRSIGQSRMERIARGSGRSIEDVRALLDQYKMMSRAIKQFQGMGNSDMQRMMKQMQGGGGGIDDLGDMGPFG
jgi:signal recognition particle subunit SRP54